MTTPDAALLELLAEVDLPADDALGGILEEIRALGAGPAPVPAPAVAELLAGSGARRRGRHHRRGAIIGALVLVSLGTGVTAAAADPDVRAGAADAVAAVVHVVRAEPVHPVARHTPVPAASDPVLVGAAAAPHGSAHPSASAAPVAVVPRRGVTVSDDHRPSSAPGSGGSPGAPGRGSSGSSHGSSSGSGNGSSPGKGAGEGSGSGSGHGSDGGSGAGRGGGSEDGGSGQGSGDGGSDGTGSDGSGSHGSGSDGGSGGGSGGD